jgi:hypothetical protein
MGNPAAAGPRLRFASQFIKTGLLTTALGSLPRRLLVILGFVGVQRAIEAHMDRKFGFT